MKPHGIQWRAHGILWRPHETSWSLMEVHESPWNCMEFHGTPLELHGGIKIPWKVIMHGRCQFHKNQRELMIALLIKKYNIQQLTYISLPIAVS